MCTPAQPSAPKPIPTDQIFPRWERFLRAGWIAAAVAVVALGHYFWRRSRPEVYVPDVNFSPATQWTADSGVSINPVFSGDGKLVAYSSDRGGSGNLAVWIRPFPSGEPRKLSSDQFDQTDPDFSPDGRSVAYHSSREGGGIYATPVSGGGQPVLLAKGGFRPRYSPDGRWIAFYTLPGHASEMSPFGGGRVYLIPAEGGKRKQIQPDFPSAQFPVWSQDGEWLLFEGVNGDGTRDWWVTAPSAGEAVRTRALERIEARVGAHLGPERWVGDRVFFPATGQTNLHLWEERIAPASWQAMGLPRQVTGGDWIEQGGSIGPKGQMLFARMRVAVDIWSMPLGERGAPAGKLERITDDHALNQAPSVAARGDRMVYLSSRSGMRDLWVTDLKTGGDRALTSFQNVGYRPTLSPDGSRVVYRTTIDGRCAVIQQELEQKQRRTQVPGCFSIWDWSPEGAGFLAYNPRQTPVSADLVKADSGERRELISSAKASVLDAGFSPDGRWVAFSAGSGVIDSEVYVAPVRSTTVKESDWIPVTHGGGSLAAWSPDGAVLYFHSQRDGFHCIWAQALDGGKRPSGEPFAVQHLHSVAFGMYMIKAQDFHMSVGKDRIILNLATEIAHLWITE